LLHVIDASDPFVGERISVVHDVLSDIWANQKRILVFNKTDLIDEEKLAELKKLFPNEDKAFISVKNNIWLDELKYLIAKNV
jgi:50S ribosomal subunit-associated GTPase HflX